MSNKYYKYGDARYKATEGYQRRTMRKVVLKLNRNTDADLIEWIEHLDNIQGTIKEILKEHIKK